MTWGEKAVRNDEKYMYGFSLHLHNLVINVIHPFSSLFFPFFSFFFLFLLWL